MLLTNGSFDIRQVGGRAGCAWIYLMPELLLDTNIVNLSGDFDEVSTYSDNSHVILNSVR